MQHLCQVHDCEVQLQGEQVRPEVVHDVRPGALLQIAFHVQHHLPLQVEPDFGMIEQLQREAAQGVPDHGQPQEMQLSNLQSFRYQHAVPRYCLFPDQARHDNEDMEPYVMRTWADTGLRQPQIFEISPPLGQIDEHEQADVIVLDRRELRPGWSPILLQLLRGGQHGPVERGVMFLSREITRVAAIAHAGISHLCTQPEDCLTFMADVYWPADEPDVQRQEDPGPSTAMRTPQKKMKSLRAKTASLVSRAVKDPGKMRKNP